MTRTITVTYDDGNEDFVITEDKLDKELSEWYLYGGYDDLRDWSAEDLENLRFDTPEYECARVLDAAIQRASIRDN